MIDLNHLRQQLANPPPPQACPVARQPAAVLLTIVTEHDHQYCLLTERQQHLSHHQGQISLPGGAAEAQDQDLAATALRETEEELGISHQHIDIIGELNAYPTLTSHYWVKPFVGIIEHLPTLTVQTSEVANVIYLPIDYLLEKAATNTKVNFATNRYFEFNFENYRIWGITAMILYDFAKHCLKKDK